MATGECPPSRGSASAPLRGQRSPRRSPASGARSPSFVLCAPPHHSACKVDVGPPKLADGTDAVPCLIRDHERMIRRLPREAKIGRERPPGKHRRGCENTLGAMRTPAAWLPTRNTVQRSQTGTGSGVYTAEGPEWESPLDISPSIALPRRCIGSGSGSGRRDDCPLP